MDQFLAMACEELLARLRQPPAITPVPVMAGDGSVARRCDAGRASPRPRNTGRQPRQPLWNGKEADVAAVPGPGCGPWLAS